MSKISHEVIKKEVKPSLFTRAWRFVKEYVQILSESYEERYEKQKMFDFDHYGETYHRY